MVLFLELCRQSTGYFRKIVIVYPHLFRCSTIKIHNFSSTSVETFCCLAFITFQYIVQFSRCNFVNTSFVSYAASQAIRLIHFAVSPLPRQTLRWFVFGAWIRRSGFEARSQNPVSWVLRSNSKLDLVGPSGLEPPTLRLSVVRSSQLSYGPVYSLLVEIVGIEPATSCLQGRRSPS